jgi:hypothetical protein
MSRCIADFFVPVQTRNPLNNRQHWRTVQKRAKSEKHVAAVVISAVSRAAFQLPVVVKMTRYSTGRLDSHDGLRAACKHIADTVAEWLGVDDGDASRITFQYAQEKCKRGQYGVRVEVFPCARLVETIQSVEPANDTQVGRRRA